MKLSNLTTNLKLILIIIAIVFVGIISIILLRKNPALALKDIKKAIKTKKNEAGTQKLPDSPDLDKTLKSILKDIMSSPTTKTIKKNTKK